MTLSGNRGRNRPEKPDPKYPWLIPLIAVVAIAIVVVGLIFAVSMGIKLF